MNRRFSDRQQGIGLGYLMFVIVLVTLVSGYMLKNSGTMSGMAVDGQYMSAANDLDRAANELSVRMAQIRLSYGASTPVQITAGQFVSPTTAFPAMTLPAVPASSALGGWSMVVGDRLLIPFAGDLVPVATITVTNAVCKKFNATHIRADAPVLLATPGNVFGGTTYSVTNGGFNAAQPSTLFCVEGAGAGSEALLIVGFLAT